MNKPKTKPKTRSGWSLRKRRPTYALALSGGAALGAYQAGTLRAIHEAELDVKFIAGSSVGALNGFMAATGQINELLDFWRALDQTKLISVNSVTKFLFSNMPSILTDDVQRQLIDKYASIAQLKKSEAQFFCTAISLSSGKLHYFDGSAARTDAELQQFILASAAVPGVFPAVEIGGELFMDGGLLRNTPVEALEQCCVDCVLAIAMEPEQYPADTIANTGQIALRTLSIFFRQQASDAIERARNSKTAKAKQFLLLRPELPLDMQQYELDPKKIALLIEQGFSEAKLFITKNKLR